MSLPSKRLQPRRKGTPAPRIKPGRIEDPAHLKRVRALPCMGCEIDQVTQTTRTEAHHIRRQADGAKYGKGQKAHDLETIPLCPRHHNEQHPDSFSTHRNPKEFTRIYGTERELLTKTLALLNVEAA